MGSIKAGHLLEKIEFPSDLRSEIKETELKELSTQLRQYIIDVVSENGGHFSASLGVVELTVALHYVFNTPYDQLVWDVGHQAHGHKILTGRKNSFISSRKKDGISGFPKRSESEYDAFGVGHSSTSISATLGMAIASKAKGELNKQHVAVIGDGAMTAGLAFEGLNHAGVEDTNLLVILNDNSMSIDPNVGALKEYLTDISTSGFYNRAKDKLKRMLEKNPKFGSSAQTVLGKIERTLKTSILKQSNLFESLNFRYFGPVDGHDVDNLVKVMRKLKELPGPKVLHVLTKKGKGYGPSEQGSATTWHAPGVFNKDTGEIIKVTPKSPEPPKYQDVFGHTIVELAEKNEKIMGVTPAMLSGSSLHFMMEAMPERVFDVGIAEQHAVTFSAGLATQGMVPFCNIYSSFMQRAYDQVIHDVALQNLNVVFCLDRSGFVGADGATHHGAYDLAFFRSIPNMIVSAPMNESELRNLMYTAQQKEHGPFSIRYPRGKGVMTDWKTPLKEIKMGTGRRVRNGSDLAVLSIGHTGNFALAAAENLKEQDLDIAVYDMRFVKPLDEILLHEVFSKFENVITVEDGSLMGGMGSAILEFMGDHGYRANVKRLGIDDKIFEHGTQQELYSEAGFSVEDITATAEEMLSKKIGREGRLSAG
ncbi:MAG: 1-deoxy-D-xylulose-5-phosphate synthase [Bacteroidota bacterium]